MPSWGIHKLEGGKATFKPFKKCPLCVSLPTPFISALYWDAKGMSPCSKSPCGSGSLPTASSPQTPAHGHRAHVARRGWSQTPTSHHRLGRPGASPCIWLCVGASTSMYGEIPTGKCRCHIFQSLFWSFLSWSCVVVVVVFLVKITC